MDDFGIALTKIISDMEIAARIYWQYCDIHEAVNLPKDVKADILRIIVEVMRKLEAAKYHKDNLLRVIDEEVGREVPIESSPQVDLTTGAEKELEAFIMQGKSCLDVLTKIFSPLIGIKIHSYGNSGESVVKVLENNLPDAEKESAEPLIQMIRDDRNWIEKWFKSERDSITHYRAVQSSGFFRRSFGSGDAVIELPKTPSGIPLHEIVETNYANLIGFCEDFIALALSIKFMKNVILGVLPEEKKDETHPRKYGLFFKPGKKEYS